MRNCYVVTTEDNSDKFWSKIVLWLIKKASKSKWTHTQVVIDDVLYECRYPQGFRKKNYVFTKKANNRRDFFLRDLTEKEKGAIIGYFEYNIAHNIKYGVVKLLTFCFLAPTKNLWKKLGFAPMSFDKVWGEFCSAAVDTAFRYAGIDLLPGENEEYSSPGDVIKSHLLVEE